MILEGKVALVTGSTSGIGLAIAKALAAEGAKLMINGFGDPADIERELTFVFVGAGYAGVEALAELRDLVRDALRYYPTLKDVAQHWVLVDAAPKILAEIPAGSANMRRT